ncbi:RING finger protein 165 [Smittium mucronatum]|uniref:RING-type E3 ubiquitin transferase n=1 Tax=Smittium mucronatum TaxID=133383 RepID=A0A1R0H877_9FUNG|nr:RING finger protein 165 [Smittium mucronatum]
MVNQSTHIIHENGDRVFEKECQGEEKIESDSLKETSKDIKVTIYADKNRVATETGNAYENQEQTQTNYDLDCLICFEKINIGEDIRRIPCLHMFHRECLDQWLLERVGSCPNCRLDLHTETAKDHKPINPELVHISSAASSSMRIENQVSPDLNIGFNRTS